MIEAIPHKGGAGRAKIVCDDCGRDEVIPCSYVGSANASSGNARPNESQARAKALQMKWSFIKGKLRCPSCDAKRKVVPMKPATPATTATPEPTKRERIQIISMLSECYDLDAERYTGGDTDETVADVLGVRPGFVSIIREAEFGPAGVNEDMAALKIELEAAIIDAEKRVMEAEAKAKSASAAVAVMHGLRERLGKIETAVGKRVMARA